MRNKFRAIENIFLALGIISTVIISGEASGWKNVFGEWTLWITLPYFTFFIVSYSANRKASSRNVYLASFITSIIIVILPLLIYVDAFYIHSTSTSALVFIFIPFYVLIGGPAIFFVISKLIKVPSSISKCNTFRF